MKNKGQVTIFVIVGIVLIIVFGLVYFFLNNSSKENFESMEFSDIGGLVSLYVKDCMINSLIEGINEFGIPEGNSIMNDYILLKTLECLNNFDDLKESVTITTGETYFSTLTNEENVVTYEFLYEINVNENGKKSNFDRFSIEIDKTLLSFDFENGVSTKEIILFSVDKKAKIIVPKDTLVLDENNDPVKFVGLKILDKTENGMRNRIVLGNLVYEGLPRGAQFSPPEDKKVTMSYYYREEDIEPILSDFQTEEDLTCGYLSVSGAYIPWESNVDTEKNILTCEIEHFSINSPITNCKQPSTYGGAESNGVTVLIYQQPCILSVGKYL